MSVASERAVQFHKEEPTTHSQEHKDTKAQSHKERPLLKVIYAAFLCGFVPLCLCVHPNVTTWLTFRDAGIDLQRQVLTPTRLQYSAILHREQYGLIGLQRF